MKVPYEFYDANFEVICQMNKNQLADRIIQFANKLKTESNDVENLTHIQDVVNMFAFNIDPEVLL